MAGINAYSRECPRWRREPKHDTSSDARKWANRYVREPRKGWSELDDFAPEWRIAPRPDLLGCVGRMHRIEDICPHIRERTLCNPLNVAGSVTGGSVYPPLPRHYTSERIPYDMHCVEAMPLEDWPENLRCRKAGGRPRTASCCCQEERSICPPPKTCTNVNRSQCQQHRGNCTSCVGVDAPGVSVDWRLVMV